MCASSVQGYAEGSQVACVFITSVHWKERYRYCCQGALNVVQEGLFRHQHVSKGRAYSLRLHKRAYPIVNWQRMPCWDAAVVCLVCQVALQHQSRDP